MKNNFKLFATILCLILIFSACQTSQSTTSSQTIATSSTSENTSSSSTSKKSYEEYYTQNKLQTLKIKSSTANLTTFIDEKGDIYISTKLSNYTVNENNKLTTTKIYEKVLDGISTIKTTNENISQTYFLFKLNIDDKFKIVSEKVLVSDDNTIYYIGGGKDIPYPLTFNNISTDDKFVYRKLAFTEEIVDVKSNNLDNFILTKNGELYCLGSMSLYGGIGESKNKYFMPIKVKTPAKVKKIALTNQQLYIICEDECLYHALLYGSLEGICNYPEFNENTSNTVDVFSKVETKTNVKDVICGKCLAMFVSTDDFLYVYDELADYLKSQDDFYNSNGKEKIKKPTVEFIKNNTVGKVDYISNCNNDMFDNYVVCNKSNEFFFFEYMDYNIENPKLNVEKIVCDELSSTIKIFPTTQGLLAIDKNGNNYLREINSSIFAITDDIYWKDLI